MGNKSIHKVYSDKRITTIVSVNVKNKWGYSFLTSIKVKRTNNKEYEFSYADLSRLGLNDIEGMYLLKVQGKLHHRVESYQRTLNLTKPNFYFSCFDYKIPYNIPRTKKGAVYLNKYNVRSLMKLYEVHKFCNGALLKVQDNLLKMVNENKLGRGNVELEGRVWTKSDIKRLKHILRNHHHAPIDDHHMDSTEPTWTRRSPPHRRRSPRLTRNTIACPSIGTTNTSISTATTCTHPHTGDP
nr:hypothetical protein [Tanacetum cinerariifolium]